MQQNMLLLIYLTTLLSGVISMYLKPEYPSVTFDNYDTIPVVDVTRYLKLERELDNKKQETTKRYLSSTLDEETHSPIRKRSALAGGKPSLSIVNPLDVLRQKLLLDIARNRKHTQIERNREYLQKIGKRSIIDLLSTEQD